MSLVSVKQLNESLRVVVEYRKQGGRQKNAYQAYLLAYLDKNAAHIPAEAPKDAIDTSEVLVLHTQVVERNKAGDYEMEFTIAADVLVRSAINHGIFVERPNSETAASGFHQYDDKLRLAIFIPFLDDEKYSVLPGFPEDKHECNYLNERALLFQPLPCTLTITRYFSKKLFSIAINNDQRGRP